MINQGFFAVVIVLTAYVANTNAFLRFVHIPKLSMNLESYLKKNVKPTYFNTGWWLGDGFCDDDLNNEECNWDNGDCDSALATTVTSSFSSCNPPIHILTLWIGDGFCDTELNNLDCGNDGGDCNDGMASTIQPITTMQTPPTTEAPEHLGDGVCHVELNYAMCDWDDGDCQLMVA